MLLLIKRTFFVKFNQVKASHVKPKGGGCIPHEGDGGMDVNNVLSCGHVRMHTLEPRWFMHAVIELTR